MQSLKKKLFSNAPAYTNIQPTSSLRHQIFNASLVKANLFSPR